MPKMTNVTDAVVETDENEAAQPSRLERIKKFATNPNVMIAAGTVTVLAIVAVIANKTPVDYEITEEMAAEDEAITTY